MVTAGPRAGPYLHFGTQRASAAFAGPSYSKGDPRARVARFRYGYGLPGAAPRFASILPPHDNFRASTQMEWIAGVVSFAPVWSRQ